MIGYPALRRSLVALACTLALTSSNQAFGQGKVGAPAKDKDHKNGKAEATHLSGEDAEKVHQINEQLSSKWKENKINPAAKASDFEFIRRASLDIIGRVAKPAEIEISKIPIPAGDSSWSSVCSRATNMPKIRPIFGLFG